MSSAGFDCGSYPGDAAMKTWASQSPYQFVGFYLDSRCHSRNTFETWSGKSHFLTDLGWGLAVVYVGFQQQGCGSAHLSRAAGLQHGADTIDKCQQEGFPDGTIVFLDVEHVDGAMSTAMTDYYRGWVSAILDGGSLNVGTYCSKANANDIVIAAQAEFADHGLPSGSPTLWIVKTSDPLFDPATSAPADCGVASAAVWQGRIDVPGERHGGIPIDIDQNVASSADPSNVRRPVVTT